MSPNESMSTVTFDEIATCARDYLGRARGELSKDSWTRLVQVIDEYRAGTDNTISLLDGERWWLTRLEVQGFRGVGGALSLELPATPGLTLIHGPNGSGKSSLSHATELALRVGDHPSLPRADGPKKPPSTPWDPILTFERSSESKIHALLKRGDENLDLRLTIRSSPDAKTYTAEPQVLHSRADGESTLVQPDSDWQAALDSFLPTYSYADWERSLSTQKDLRTYLLNLLALGSRFNTLRHDIKDRQESAAVGEKALHAARDQAAASIALLSIEGDSDTVPSPIRVDLPEDLTTSPGDWWTSQGLDTAPLDTSATASWAESVAHVIAKAPTLASLAEKLCETSSSEAEMLAILQELSEQPHGDPNWCPVCGTKTPWREHLQKVMTAQSEAATAVSNWTEALAGLALDAATIAAAVDIDAPALGKLCSAVRAAHQSHQDVGVNAAETIRLWEKVAASVTQQAKDDLDAAVQAIEQTSVINRKIHAAASQFYDAWREHHGAPADKAAWQWANKYLDKVEAQLKQNRESDLARRVDSFVSNLLDDAGLNVRNVKVQKSRADLVLERASGASDGDAQDGQEIQLGMLSAGQRNAVILAPALAVAENGPFGFMVLDDPVHAFDELRVDRTAKALVQIARARRVIVLTHDERLKEQLLAASVDVDVRSISRDSSGTLEVLGADAVWRVLLEDARRLHRLGHLQQMTTPIRGLCRQAVDNALRLFVTQQAVRSGAAPDEWLSQLDSVGVFKLSERLDAAESLSVDEAGRQALAEARGLLGEYDEPWNRASHGQASTLPDKQKVTELELDAAEKIGQALTGARSV